VKLLFKLTFISNQVGFVVTQPFNEDSISNQDHDFAPAADDQSSATRRELEKEMEEVEIYMRGKFIQF
jgi:hypothetical protein